MNFISKMINYLTLLIKSKSIRNELSEIKETIANDTASLIPYGSTFLKILKTMRDIPSMIFWTKIERFLCGIDTLSFNERQQMSQRFVDDGYTEYVKRLVYLINEIDADDKIDYIANLTRAFAQNFIGSDMYFRLVHSIQKTLNEDLIFLSTNVRKRNISTSINIVSLQQSGLAYQSVIDEHGDNKYEISDLGINVVVFGINYDNMEEYKDLLASQGEPMAMSTGMKPIPNEYIDNLFSKKVNKDTT